MNDKQKQRKERKRKEKVKAKLLRRRTLMREGRKLEKELWKLKKEQEPKLTPLRKNTNDNQS